MEPAQPSPSLLDRLRIRRAMATGRAWAGVGLLAAALVAFLIERSEKRSAAPVRPAAATPATRPDAGDLLATLAAALPPDATLRRVELAGDGGLSVEVDAPDPERLRAALRGAGPLATLRTESEAAVPDHGYRIRLTGPLPGRSPAAQPVAAAQLRDRARGLLVETLTARPDGVALAVSGPEPQVARLAAGLALRRWRLEADGGAVRLSGLAAGLRVPGALPSRPLFAADAPAASSGGPVLAGIVGRLPDAAVALVRLPDGRARSVAVGATVDGWTLAAVSADAAVFTHGGERLRVEVAGGEE